MKRICGAAGSLLLHALVIFLLLSHTSVVYKPPEQHTAVDVEYAREQKLKGEETIGNGLECGGYHYTGVGILVASSGRILDVGPNTPASRAGLKEGDILVDENQLAPDRFVIGTTVHVLVRRDGVVFDVPIHIGRICSE